jgi:hypothetical protein
MKTHRYTFASLLFVLTQLIPFRVAAGSPADSPAGDLKLIQSQLNKIKSDEAAERSRVNSDEQTIRLLEQQLKAITARDAEFANKDQQLELSDTQLKT